MEGWKIRQPVIVVVGHVDHGKTTLLDKIRGTAVALREPGAITQWIGASEVPASVIKKLCGKLMDAMKLELTIPGLLFIDTPGHEAFTNLRRRGGALADLAVLVVDISEGFLPQTMESIDILRANRTPFVLVANKIDLLPGWRPLPNTCFLESFSKQTPEVQYKLDSKIYEFVGKLHEIGFRSERFDRVSDFTRDVCIVPVSAKTGEGIPEVLLMLAGLAQRFLEKELTIAVTSPARGTVLEVKEEGGMGTTMDVIVYDGVLRKGDEFAVGGMGGVITSKVKGLLQPKPLDEIRDPEDKFRSVDEVVAAAGVKVMASGIEGVVAGSLFRVISNPSEAEELWSEIREELSRLRIVRDITGIVLKADALGSLEALERKLREADIPIRMADVGNVSKRDIMEAAAIMESDPSLGVVLAFNVAILPDAKREAEIRGVPILKEEIIYKVLDDYRDFARRKKEEIRRKKLEGFIRPGKFSIKPGFVFRRSKPAIVGVDVLGGAVRPKDPVMDKDGKQVGVIKELQKEKKTLTEARLGEELAVSIEGPMVGRDIQEGDILYVDVPKEHVTVLRSELRDLLTGDELSVLDETIAIKRRIDQTYGVM